MKISWECDDNVEEKKKVFSQIYEDYLNGSDRFIKELNKYMDNENIRLGRIC